MGTALDTLLVRLARVVTVAPYVQARGGRIVPISGYSYTVDDVDVGDVAVGDVVVIAQQPHRVLSVQPGPLGGTLLRTTTGRSSAFRTFHAGEKVAKVRDPNALNDLDIREPSPNAKPEERNAYMLRHHLRGDDHGMTEEEIGVEPGHFDQLLKVHARESGANAEDARWAEQNGFADRSSGRISDDETASDRGWPVDPETGRNRFAGTLLHYNAIGIRHDPPEQIAAFEAMNQDVISDRQARIRALDPYVQRIGAAESSLERLKVNQARIKRSVGSATADLIAKGVISDPNAPKRRHRLFGRG